MPVQPTQYWTFDNASALLESLKEPFIVGALDEFLLLNSPVILSSLPLGTYDKDYMAPKNKDFVLRKVVYSTSGNNIKDAETLAPLLNINFQECLRIISQFSKRYPERKVHSEGKLQSMLPDDRLRSMESDRLYLYAGKILRERRQVLKIAVQLLNSKSNELVSSTVRNLGKELFLSKDYVLGILNAIRSTIEDLAPGSSLSPAMRELILNENTLLLVELFRVLIELLWRNPIIDPIIVTRWFLIMKDCDFTASLGSIVASPESSTLLQALMTVTAALLLDLDDSFESATSSYFTDGKAFASIDECMPYHNPTILYCWYVLMMRKYIYVQEDPSAKFLDDMPLTRIQHSLRNLNEALQSMNPFDHISTLNDYLSFDRLYSEILLTVVLAAMPFISLDNTNAKYIANIISHAPNPMIERFFEDEPTTTAIVIARTKFPSEMGPYLEIAGINGNFAAQEFAEMRSCVQIYDKQEFERMYQIDDEDTLLVRLTCSVDIYPPFEESRRLSLSIATGTKAKILPSAIPGMVLVTFLYKYSGWAFLGRIIYNISRFFNVKDLSKMDSAIQITRILTRAALDCTPAELLSILDQMSYYMDDLDIIEVVFRLLEQGLHERHAELCESLVQLLTALVPVCSSKLWPRLTKSSLFLLMARDGLASVIFGSVEMVTGNYRFTTALVMFVDALTARSLSLAQDFPTRLKLDLLAQAMSYISQVHDAIAHCNFQGTSQKLRLCSLIIDVFSMVLVMVHGAKVGNQVAAPIMDLFSASARVITRSFLAPGTECPRLCMQLMSIVDALGENLSSFEARDMLGFNGNAYLRSNIEFAKLLVHTRSVLQEKPSSLEVALYNKLKQLVRAYSQYEFIRQDVILLLSEIIKGVWPETSNPSMLAHLGRDDARLLLHALSADMDNAFDDYHIKLSIYTFVCHVFEGQQEGLSVMFISGRAMFGEEGLDESAGKSLMSVMKKNVRDICFYPYEVSVHLLDAISLAYNSWNMARDLLEDADFLDELMLQISVPITDAPKTIERCLSQCSEKRLCAKMAEVLSLFLFTTQDKDTRKKIFALLESDQFFSGLVDRLTIKDVHPNLVTELSGIFESQYGGLQLTQFSRSTLKRNEFSESSLYNLPLMNALLGREESWPDMRDKIIAASVNLQSVDAQISVCQSFGGLMTAFCRRYTGTLPPKYLTFVLSLLKLNLSQGTSDERLRHVLCGRNELAFYITYTMYTNLQQESHQTLFEITKASIGLLSSPSMNLIPSLTTSSGFHRPLLRILFCCLDTIKNDSKLLFEYYSVFMEVFVVVVIKATQTLLIEVQNDVYSLRADKTHKLTIRSKIDDLNLILFILKTFVTLKVSQKFHLDMARAVKNSGIANLLLSLLNMSHAIEVDDQHVFAQISLMMIQEFISIHGIAEIFVNAGLFVVIADSAILTPIKAGNLSCGQNDVHYKIWNSGILKVMCICLAKMGPLVLNEVCVALCIFSRQIQSCIASWLHDLSSLSILSARIQETGQLLILYDLLDVIGAHDCIPTDENAVDMLVFPGWESESRRLEFVDTLGSLLKHPKFLSSRIVASSGDEQRIIDEGGAEMRKFADTLMSEINDLMEAFDH